MYKELKSKIKHKERVDIDFRGIFFYILRAVIIRFNIFIFNKFTHFICFLKGVKLGHNITFHGNPIIHRYPNSSIRFGNDCKFNSAKNSISIGLDQPCSFVTWDENAEIVFGNNSGASGLKINARSTITIGNNVLIGASCIILDNDSHHSNPQKRHQNIFPAKPICIEDNVFIGTKCVILKGVTIGKNSVIGAGSIVFNNIPENSIALGNPCKVIMIRNLN